MGERSVQLQLLLADDHDLVRETIAAFLKEEGCEVVEASDLDGALTCLSDSAPFDVVILDYTMPGMNGLEGLSKVIDVSPGCPVAIISGTATRSIANSALRLGAGGYIPKSLPSKSLVNAIRFIAAGEVYVPFSYLTDTDEQDGSAPMAISARERQVLIGICEGKSNKEIARELDLQEVTIKLHAKNLFEKIHAKNRTHAAMIARDLQLV